ncbi:MAG: DUF2087 domain-containing protein [Oscillospiraceae bacterium]|nr:DUF2087 domain-containing protein [Oscillospiraceae bacterium]
MRDPRKGSQHADSAIPPQRKEARIILEVFAKAFEYDRINAEREVNLLIADYHDGFCTIRRDMIVKQPLAKDSANDWRVKPESLE